MRNNRIQLISHDGGAEQPLPSETSPGVLVPETKRRGFCCEKSLSPETRYRNAKIRRRSLQMLDVAGPRMSSNN